MKETFTPALRSRRSRDAIRHVAAVNRPESVGYLMSASTTVVSTRTRRRRPRRVVGRGEQFPVQRLDQLGTAAAGQLADRRLVGHRRLEPDPAEPPPTDRVGHLDTQPLIAQPVAVLQEHQPQIGLDRDRRPPSAGIEERPKRNEEPPVIEQHVDLGELARQHPHPRRQQQLEQRTLRAYSAQHDGLDPY